MVDRVDSSNYPSVIKHGNGKSPIHGGLNGIKTSINEEFLHGQVWLVNRWSVKKNRWSVEIQRRHLYPADESTVDCGNKVRKIALFRKTYGLSSRLPEIEYESPILRETKLIHHALSLMAKSPFWLVTSPFQMLKAQCVRPLLMISPQYPIIWMVQFVNPFCSKWNDRWCM